MPRFARRIRPSVTHELEAAGRAEAGGEVGTAFSHLERAHVLGQAATAEHVRVHWHMFRWAVRQRKPAEFAGQAWRLLAALLLTGIGRVPEGNTGGSGVSAVRRMCVPDDLQRLIDAARA